MAQSTTTFEKECVEALNNYRQRHSAEALQVKEELSKHAQEFAKRLAASGQIRHSNNRKYGENLAVSKKRRPSGEYRAALGHINNWVFES